MKVLRPKNAVERTTSTHGQRGERAPAVMAGAQHGRCAVVAAAAVVAQQHEGISSAGGMNSAVAPTPQAISAGVASTGARKKPTLPPAAKMLIAPALSPAASLAALPAEGWNMAMPRPESRIAHQTAA